MPLFNLKYKLVQEFEVEREAESLEAARKDAERTHDFALAACERAGDLDIVDFDFISGEEISESKSSWPLSELRNEE